LRIDSWKGSVEMDRMIIRLICMRIIPAVLKLRVVSRLWVAKIIIGVHPVLPLSINN
jgi:hypothetical protein